MTDDLVERAAQAIHEHLCHRTMGHSLVIGEELAINEWNTRAAMQADAAPVAWMYERGPETIILQEQLHRDGVLRGVTGWTETPLYAHPPVGDRISTSSPVDVSETGNTSDKLAALQIAADKLAGYAGHDEDCEIMKHGVWTDSIPCTCGYTDAWWAYEAAKQARK